MSNYTAKMVDAIKAASPLDLGKAKDLAADFGVSHRSVISKAISLGVQYNKAAKPMASIKASKLDTVNAIAKGLNMPVADLDGLQNARASALDNLLANIS